VRPSSAKESTNMLTGFIRLFQSNRLGFD